MAKSNRAAAMHVNCNVISKKEKIRWICQSGVPSSKCANPSWDLCPCPRRPRRSSVFEVL